MPLSRHFVILFLLVGVCLSIARAQQAGTVNAADPPARPKVALVLSGGGARGLAHVGVLKVLEQSRVPVDMVVGTSMGAIIGGLYAAGMSPDELERQVAQLDWGGLFERREPRQLLSQRRKEEDFELAPLMQLGFRDGEFRLPTGAVSTRSLEMLLRRHTLPVRHLASFDGLPLPFRAVATDMESGEAVVLDHGDLAAALRASMSVPGVFSPLEIDGRILGDGGLVDNLPVEVARRMGADIVIAVNTAQMVNILTEQNVRRSIDLLTTRDLLLQPPLGALTSADFDKAADLVALGERYALSVREAIERFSQDPMTYAQWRLERDARLAHLSERGGRVGMVRFEGVQGERLRQLQRLVESRPGQALDVDRIERDVRQLAATGDYERVDYRLERLPEQADEALVVQLRENGWGPNYLGLGLDLRTDFDGQSAFNLRLHHTRRWLSEGGSEWRSRVQLGSNLQASSEIYQPIDAAEGRFVSAYGAAGLRRADLFDGNGEAAAVIKRRSVDVGVDYGMPFGVLGRIGELRVGWFESWRHARPELVGGSLAGLDDLLVQRWRESGLRLALVADQLDYANFPSEGYRLKTEWMTGRRRVEGLPRERLQRVEASAVYAHSWGRHTINLGTRLARVNQLPVGALDEYSLGGFQQLSGYRIGQVIGSRLAFGRLTYYHRQDWATGVARAVFLGGSIEAGNAWQRGEDVSLRKLRWGSSLFVGADTALGPLYLGLVSAPKGYTGLYLFLGRP
jgi:NTE family protein